MEAAIYQKKTKINYKPILYVIPENSVLFWTSVWVDIMVCLNYNVTMEFGRRVYHVYIEVKLLKLTS